MFLMCYSHEGMSSAGGDGSGSAGGLGGVQGGRNTPPHGSPTPMDKATLKVHLPNGKCITGIFFFSLFLDNKIAAT